MYDALLEDFEDDVSRTNDDEENFDKLPVAEIDEEEDSDDGSEETSSNTNSQATSEEDEFLIAEGDSESWSDDPVRMYLTQMGEIPLLTRQQEIELAKRIEVTRRRFRTKLLECDYVIQTAFKVLKRVHEGEITVRSNGSSFRDRSLGKRTDSRSTASQLEDAGCFAET